MRPYSLSVILLLMISGSLSGQQFEWSARMDGFLDNREYYSIDLPKTMFGSRAKVEAGFSLDSRHRFRFGLDYLYEFGQEPGLHAPGITMYYQYDADHTDFRIGAFPRATLIHFPVALLSDTLRYYRPNVEGAYLGFRGEWGNQQIFIDWTSRKSDWNYEQFTFGFSGQLKRGILFVNHHFLMGHFAGRGMPDPDFHLRDNGGFHLNMGTGLSQVLFLDTLSFSFGTLVSLDRIRGVEEGWQTPAGFLGEFSARYRWFGLQGLYYRGQGHTFLYGDPFYRMEQYGRIDLSYVPFSHGSVDLRFIVGIHFATRQVDFSQQILLTMKLDGTRNIRNE